MKILEIAAVGVACILVPLACARPCATAQKSIDEELRNSPDARMAPRSLLLMGGPLDSARGLYVIEFPYPNDCVEIAPVRATSRPMALYVAVSRGGFSLQPSEAGLTVWTIEEWTEMKSESWYPQFIKAKAENCKKRADPQDQPGGQK